MVRIMTMNPFAGRPNTLPEAEARINEIREWASTRCTDSEIAERLGISAKTFQKHKRVSQLITDAVIDGRRPVIEEAEGSLGKLVNGYDYTETDTVYETDVSGKPTRAVSIKVMKRRHHPEIRAINYLLKRYENQCELDI